MLTDDPILDLSRRILNLPDDRLYALAEIIQSLVQTPVESPDDR